MPDDVSDDGIEVWAPTPEEWDQAVAEQLAKFSLTFEEVRQQARSGDWSSPEVRDFWVVMGGWTAEPLPCLVCGRQLRRAIAGSNQPYFGMMCSTSGNYGSTAFDSARGDDRLEFNVCDDCMVANAARIRNVRYRSRPDTIIYSRVWDPERHNGD